MSKYTVELRYIIDNEKLFPPTEGTLSLKSALENYPLYNETYVDPITQETRNRRDEINNKILNHYYFREIGFETVPRFLFHLQRKMNEIMNYYNQMYKSADIEFNPLWNVEMHETYTHTIEGTGNTTTDNTNVNSGTDTSTSENLNVESDTPQTGVTEADIKANTYASKTDYDKRNVSNTLGTQNHLTGEINSTDNKTETFEKLTEGSSAGLPYSDAIRQWRHIMVNIDMMIIDELKDLFMNVW
jgi:hypothetical protein